MVSISLQNVLPITRIHQDVVDSPNSQLSVPENVCVAQLPEMVLTVAIPIMTPI